MAQQIPKTAMTSLSMDAICGASLAAAMLVIMVAVGPLRKMNATMMLNV
jgi:hypothetical protein